MTIQTWFTGYNNFQKLTLLSGQGENQFITEMVDVETQPFQTIQETFAAHLTGATHPVEVLYSGGMDSEFVLKVCLQNKTPVTAITMRLMFRGSPINVQDLYYAEKFCRENSVSHKIVDLDYEPFFKNGDYAKYLDPYLLTFYSTATQLWLLTQCDHFPIIGGGYTWPQINIGKKIFSPIRNEAAFFDVFMRDNGITGIGNMLGHSLESNIMLAKEHVKVYLNDPENVLGDELKIRVLKQRMWENLGIGNLEFRHRFNGWEMYPRLNDWYNIMDPVEASLKRNNLTISTIKWGQKLADAIGGDSGENSDFGAGDAELLAKVRQIINSQ
jgi:hypothetical protein